MARAPLASLSWGGHEQRAMRDAPPLMRVWPVAGRHALVSMAGGGVGQSCAPPMQGLRRTEG
eukprot:8492908-Alexandrium_andersonii.AAC.1